MRSDNPTHGQRVRTFIDEARRRQIVECTIDVLAELGFARTSLAEIAKRAGISKGVISYHFAGKQELIEQVIAQVYNDEAGFLQLVRELEGSSFDKLSRYIRTSLEFIKKERKLIRALTEIFMNLRNDDGTVVYDGTAEEPIHEMLEAVLREGQERGEFCDFSPRVMAVTIHSAVNAVPMQLDLNPEMDVDAYATELIALFDRAIRVPSRKAEVVQTIQENGE